MEVAPIAQIPALPVELWHQISASLYKEAPGTAEYVDPEPYQLLVQVSRQMTAAGAKTVLSRTIHVGVEVHTILPNGHLHNEHGPAIIRGACKKWYQNNELHREDGPAYELVGVYEQWYQCGILHRSGGPAQFSLHRDTFDWFWYGKLHRDDGPATKTDDGTVKWFHHGIEYFPLDQSSTGEIPPL